MAGVRRRYRPVGSMVTCRSCGARYRNRNDTPFCEACGEVYDAPPTRDDDDGA